jgi:hypothetical protein
VGCHGCVGFHGSVGVPWFNDTRLTTRT